MPSRGILGVGSALVDVLARVDEAFLPRVGGEKGGMMMVESERQDEWISALAAPPAMAPGGAAGNTIFALAHLGMPVAMLSKLGRDECGAFYRQRLLEAGGSDIEFLETDAARTGRCLSLVTPDSERTMRSYLGASQLLTAAEAAAVDYARYDLVYVEGYLLFLPDVVPTILRCARKAGCRTAVDLASFEVVRIFREQLLELLKHDVDLVFANEEEAAALLGDGLSEQEMALRLGQICEVAAVTLGRRGSLIVRSGTLTPVAAVPARAVDTTAAGDSWAAGFLYGYLCGLPDAACGRVGSLVAAEVVQVMGSELPPERWKSIRLEIQTMKA